MSKNCGQVNIPTVDNTALDCTQIVHAGCVTVVESNKEIGSGRSEALSNVLMRIGDKFKHYDLLMHKFSKMVTGKLTQLANAISLTKVLPNLGLGGDSSVEDVLVVVDSEIGSLKGEINRLENSGEGYKNSDNININEDFSNIKFVRGSSLTKFASALNNKFSDVRDEFADVSNNLRKFEGSVNGVKLGLSTLSKDISDSRQIFSTFSPKLDDLGHDITSIKSSFNDIDWRGVKIKRGNTYFGVTGQDNLADLFEQVGKKFDSLNSKNSALENKISNVEKVSKNSSNIVVDRKLAALGVEINMPLNSVLGVINDKFAKYGVIDTSDIEVVNDEISDSSTVVVLDELLGRHHAMLNELMRKVDTLKEQNQDLKNQIDTMRRKG